MDTPALSSEIFTDGHLNTGIVLEGTNFPVDAFPNIIQDIIIDLNDNMNYSPDYVGASMIFTISTAIGNTHLLKVKKDWYESALVMVAICGDAGDIKTHPLKWILKPIQNRDAENYKRHYLEYKNYEDAISQELEAIEPIRNRHLINNTTIESIPRIHSENPRGLGYYSEELTFFLGNMSRYSNGNDISYWLSNFTNDKYESDRKGDTKPICDYDQFISLIGTIQTELIPFYMLHNDKKVNGFFERWLYAINVTNDFKYETEKEIRQQTINNWHSILTKVLNIEFDGETDSTILEFSEDAKQIYFEWQMRNADFINSKSGEVFKTFKKVQAKMQTYCKRFSLIFEVLFWASGDSNKKEVGARAMNSAIKLTEYFRDNMLKMYQCEKASTSNKNGREKVNKKMLFYNILPDEFSKKEATEIRLMLNNTGLNFNDKTLHNWLNDDSLFKSDGFGKYTKIIQ